MFFFFCRKFAPNRHNNFKKTIPQLPPNNHPLQLLDRLVPRLLLVVASAVAHLFELLVEMLLVIAVGVGVLKVDLLDEGIGEVGGAVRDGFDVGDDVRNLGRGEN